MLFSKLTTSERFPKEMSFCYVIFFSRNIPLSIRTAEALEKTNYFLQEITISIDHEYPIQRELKDERISRLRWMKHYK